MAALTIAVIIVLFGVCALVDGIFLIFSALAGANRRSRLILMEGLSGLEASAP
jgi:uncharacterized membrane protein HdeD (DUF308 family)